MQLLCVILRPFKLSFCLCIILLFFWSILFYWNYWKHNTKVFRNENVCMLKGTPKTAGTGWILLTSLTRQLAGWNQHMRLVFCKMSHCYVSCFARSYRHNKIRFWHVTEDEHEWNQSRLQAIVYALNIYRRFTMNRTSESTFRPWILSMMPQKTFWNSQIFYKNITKIIGLPANNTQKRRTWHRRTVVIRKWTCVDNWIINSKRFVNIALCGFLSFGLLLSLYLIKSKACVFIK